jgi:hypothetical protein
MSNGINLLRTIKVTSPFTLEAKKPDLDPLRGSCLFISGGDVLDLDSVGFDFQRTFLEICPSEGFQPDTDYEVRSSKSCNVFRDSVF